MEPDARKQRRAEVRLAQLQSELNRFRAYFYVAIGHGDPIWVRQCHKAIRDQQRKIGRLCAVYGLEPPTQSVAAHNAPGELTGR